MPCVSVDNNFTKLNGGAIDVNDVYYSPLYNITNYDTSVSKWINKYKAGMVQSSIDLDFDSAKTTP